MGRAFILMADFSGHSRPQFFIHQDFLEDEDLHLLRRFLYGFIYHFNACVQYFL
jgi:hypothetical protein